MTKHFTQRILAAGLLALLTLAGNGCRRQEDAAAQQDSITLNVGHFPNITHVQGLVAHHFSRQGKGWFEERLSQKLGKPVRINWYTYNAGPSAMEAIFARSLDLTYVGPGPAINAYIKSQGREIRLVSGAAEGGAALVVPWNSPLKEPADFRGKHIATPQLGNTQDIACRAWLKHGGLTITQTGGEALIHPTPNPEMLNLFRQRLLDAAWTVEPWVSRLLLSGKGQILLDESDAVTTVLAARKGFLDDHPDITQAFVEAHEELTRWIAEHPEEAQSIVYQELQELTHTAMDSHLIQEAWPRIHLTTELSLRKLQDFAQETYEAGFLKEKPDISHLTESKTAHDDAR